MNLFAIGFLGVMAACLAMVTVIGARERFADALQQMAEQGAPMLLRIPLAMFTATALATLIPQEAIGRIIGAESGWQGILLASVLGGLMPGGPMVTFPVALTVWQMGAGSAQMVAFLAAWSVFAMHRVIAFEWPIMGGRFVMVRFMSTWMLPPLAGGIAALLARFFI